MKLMTANQIEQLAREHTDHYSGAQAVSQTYLQALVFATQARLGKGRRAISADTQLEALEYVEAPYYAAVLRGVITDDIRDDLDADREERRRRMLARNSRSGFARSAKSTIVRYIHGGGDLRTVDAATVSKDALRRAVAPPEPVDRIERQIKRSSEGLQRAITRQARGDPDKARETLEAIMEDLQILLDGLEPEPESPVAAVPDRGTVRTRVGMPVIGGRRPAPGRQVHAPVQPS